MLCFSLTCVYPDQHRTVTDLRVYPAQFFYLILAIGLYVVRYRRRRLSLPRPAFKGWDIVVVFYILTNLYIVILAWYPPTTGATGGDVSFWYGTYIGQYAAQA